ncbi:MAG: UvrB/UvrC motif-containing protein [Planctomycetes bacterium]|nr:UvrB/UvrC motif-containing protein [Planctomycetota bacterium]
MNLDLDDLTADWQCSSDEISARLVTGRDGAELVQMRVDLGLLQMFPDGRPDGTRYHGMSSVREFIQHECRNGRPIDDEVWDALDRELSQLNYRRMALAQLADEALHEKDYAAARSHLDRVLRDIGAGIDAMTLIRDHQGSRTEALALWPTLVFNRARLGSQLNVVEGHFEDAIECVEDGARELESLIDASDSQADPLEPDPSVAFLKKLSRELRDQYGIELTLHERLEEALENEDFESAGKLRDELEQRKRRQRLHPPPTPES